MPVCSNVTLFPVFVEKTDARFPEVDLFRAKQEQYSDSIRPGAFRHCYRRIDVYKMRAELLLNSNVLGRRSIYLSVSDGLRRMMSSIWFTLTSAICLAEGPTLVI